MGGDGALLPLDWPLFPIVPKLKLLTGRLPVGRVAEGGWKGWMGEREMFS